MTERAGGRSALLRGAAWTLAMRWSIKLLGLFSTLLLARLLLPADYGLVAMAMLVIGLVSACADFGVTTSILRSATLERADMDAAWTLSVLQASAAGLVVALCTPLAVAFFDEPRIGPILYLIAACQVLTSTGSIGVALARRELDFGLEFRYHVIIKLFSVTVTLLAALWLRDYRALALGIASSYLLAWWLGYRLHPYRPRWNVARLGQHWDFGKWMLLVGVGNYISRKTDEVLAARVGQGHGLGAYALGSELGQLLSAELGPAMLKAFLPVLAQLRDPAERHAAVLKTLGALNALTLPAGVGLALVAPDLVSLALGAAWRDAAPLLAVFALYGSLQVLPAPITQWLIVQGQSVLLARLAWIEFLAFALAAWPCTQHYGLPGLALARLLAGVVGSAWSLRLGCVHTPLSVPQLWGALWRPCLALAGMVLCVLGVQHALAAQPPLWRLSAAMAAGVLSYASTLMLSWRLTGRPDGLEAMALQLGRQAVQRLRSGGAR